MIENPSTEGAGGLEVESADAPTTDGRRLRRQRSRQRILHALAEALSDADFELTPEQVAARSGYSISTIFRHFGGRRELKAAMEKLVRSRVAEYLVAGPFEGNVHERVRELVRRLAGTFETAAPFLRFAQRHDPRPLSDAFRRRLDAAARMQIDGALARDLAPLPPDTAVILAALLSVDTWSHMRATQDHSVARAAALLEAAVLGLLRDQPAES